MADHLKKHLIGVFLSSMAYNPSFTITYLEKHQLTKDMIDQLFSLFQTFVNTYERKLFVIGLS